jgi:uncharacterized protein (TIGR03435 family)
LMRVNIGSDPGRINYQGLSMRTILARAFTLKEYQITGPDWLDSERFDVMAKIPEGVNRDQVPVMLQALIAERFKLTFHREKKEMGVYALVVAKGGLKMKEVDPAAKGVGQLQMMGRGHLETRLSLSGLADFLSRWVDRPILDMTQTKASYDIKLEWTPEPGQTPKGMPAGMGPGGPGPGPGPGGDGPGGAGAADNPAPTIFTALQEQLGLKLEARKAPVDMVVIDHMEKAPTEN